MLMCRWADEHESRLVDADSFTATPASTSIRCPLRAVRCPLPANLIICFPATLIICLLRIGSFAKIFFICLLIVGFSSSFLIICLLRIGFSAASLISCLVRMPPLACTRHQEEEIRRRMQRPCMACNTVPALLHLEPNIVVIALSSKVYKMKVKFFT